MKFFLQYLRQYRHIIYAWLGAVCFFALSFFLYKIPVAAVWYPAAVCTLAGIIILAVRAHGEWKRHQYLQSLSNCLPELPEAMLSRTMVEADYEELLRNFMKYTAELQSSKDRQYSEMTEYYSIWAHQIKTPIAAMKLTLQNEDSPVNRRLERDLQRIEQYVEMVLTFVRLESESSDYVVKKYNLDAIVRGAIRKFAGEFIDRRLKLDYSGIDYEVVTDEKWLSFVIEQLLSNALKYTPSGSISIYMEGDVLCIRDTGIGISSEDLPRIFDKGYTGLNGRLDNHASGIGLYLCRRVCSRLSHGLTVESKPEEGTVVKLLLGRPDFSYE